MLCLQRTSARSINNSVTFCKNPQTLQDEIFKMYHRHRPQVQNDLYKKFYQIISQAIKMKYDLLLIEQMFVEVRKFTNPILKALLNSYFQDLDQVFSQSEQSQTTQNIEIQQVKSDICIDYANLQSEVHDLQNQQKFQYFESVFNKKENTLRNYLSSNLLSTPSKQYSNEIKDQFPQTNSTRNCSEMERSIKSKSIIISQNNIEQILKKENVNEQRYLEVFLENQSLKNSNASHKIKRSSAIMLQQSSISQYQLIKEVNYKEQYERKQKNTKFRAKSNPYSLMRKK